MTDKDKKCECCGNTEYYAGVASSGLGAISFAWCHICLVMGAEPKGIVEGTIDIAGGIEAIHKRVDLVYFDVKQDAYIRVRGNEIVPIILKDGIEFKTRTEYMKHLDSKEKK